MDRNEFIDRIIDRHKRTFEDEDEIRAAKQDYLAVLDYNTDFDKLYQNYLEEYNFNVAPKPAWFKQRAKKKIVHSGTNIEIRDLLVVLPDGKQYQFAYQYPLETEQQAIEEIVRRFYKKNYKLYRIAKKYETEKDNNGVEKGWLRYKEQIYI